MKGFCKVKLYLKLEWSKNCVFRDYCINFSWEGIFLWFSIIKLYDYGVLVFFLELFIIGYVLYGIWWYYGVK